MTNNKMQKAFERKLEQGLWISCFPYGYIIISGKRTKFNHNTEVILDEKKAIIIKEIFNTYVTGSYSISSLHNYINNKYNISLHKSLINRIISNKFYAGIMQWKDKEYPHKYPKIIDVDTFEKAKFIRNINNKYMLFKDFSEKFNLFQENTINTDNQKTVSQKIIEACVIKKSLDELHNILDIEKDKLIYIINELEIEDKIKEIEPGFYKS